MDGRPCKSLPDGSHEPTAGPTITAAVKRRLAVVRRIHRGQWTAAARSVDTDPRIDKAGPPFHCLYCSRVARLGNWRPRYQTVSGHSCCAQVLRQQKEHNYAENHAKRANPVEHAESVAEST